MNAPWTATSRARPPIDAKVEAIMPDGEQTQLVRVSWVWRWCVWITADTGHVVGEPAFWRA